jgi:cell division protein FtsZ
MSLHEVNASATLIANHSDPDANIIFGAVLDETLGDEMRVTVIAAGFDRDRKGGFSTQSAQTMGQRSSRPSILGQSEDDTDPDMGALDIPGFVQG